MNQMMMAGNRSVFWLWATVLFIGSIIAVNGSGHETSLRSKSKTLTNKKSDVSGALAPSPDAEPFCDVPDQRSSTFKCARRQKTNMTYHVSKYTSDMSKEDLDSEIVRAFKMWSDVSVFTFTAVDGDKEPADIVIIFVTGKHGEGFDRPFNNLNVIGHASTPRVNNSQAFIHMNDAHKFTKDSSEGTNFFHVMVHEIGHVIGLDHSKFKDAVMYPTDSAFDPNFSLSDDDINGIQELYGKCCPDVEATCNDMDFDAVISPVEGIIYAMKCDEVFYYSNGKIRSVTSPWEEAPRPADALFLLNVEFRDSTRKSTYYIKGNTVWTYIYKTSTNPQPLNKFFEGAPDSVDTAAVINYPEDAGGQSLFLFKGKEFWRVSNVVNYSGEKVDAGYPQLISEHWAGLPDDLDAAFSDEGVYYFVKKGQFYKVQDIDTLEVTETQAPFSCYYGY